MKNKLKHKFVCVLVLSVIAMAAVFPCLNHANISAASRTLVNSLSQQAEAFQPVNYRFSLSGCSDVEFHVSVPNPAGLNITLKDNQGKTFGNPVNVTSYNSTWVLDGRGWYTYHTVISQIPAGKYTAVYTFEKDTPFDVKILLSSVTESLNRNKLTVTKGFTGKLKANNAKVRLWSSQNNKIATVNKNGTVTGKKAGKTVISAKLESGTVLKCTVTVKKNAYSAKKITPDDVGINEYRIEAYSASYDSKGNLSIKFRVANGTQKTIRTVPNLHITVTDKKGKTAASYERESFKTSVAPHTAKNYSVTIPKRNIQSKKTDLRNATIKITGDRVTVS